MAFDYTNTLESAVSIDADFIVTGRDISNTQSLDTAGAWCIASTVTGNGSGSDIDFFADTFFNTGGTFDDGQVPFGWNPNSSEINFNNNGDYGDYNISPAKEGLYIWDISSSGPSGDIEVFIGPDNSSLTSVFTSSVVSTGTYGVAFVTEQLNGGTAVLSGPQVLRYQATGATWIYNIELFGLTYIPTGPTEAPAGRSSYLYTEASNSDTTQQPSSGDFILQRDAVFDTTNQDVTIELQTSTNADTSSTIFIEYATNTAGDNWTELTNISGDNTADWVTRSFDFSSIVTPTLRVRVRVSTTANFFNDFGLSTWREVGVDGGGGVGSPAITDTTPDTGVRSGDTVTITGVNFGDTQGSGNVGLINNSVTELQTVTSWSDTQITFTATFDSAYLTGQATLRVTRDDSVVSSDTLGIVISIANPSVEDVRVKTGLSISVTDKLKSIIGGWVHVYNTNIDDMEFEYLSIYEYQDLTNVNVTNRLEIHDNNTYTMSGTSIGQIANYSGANIDVLLTDGSTISSIDNSGGTDSVTLVTAVPIEITVLDFDTGLPIENANVRIQKTLSNEQILQGFTDANGVITTTYTENVPQGIIGRVRKATSPDKLFKQSSISGQIGTSGFTATVQMIPD